MSTSTAPSDVPFHLKGNYAPVETEVDSGPLQVEGVIPAELNGRYFRNGPNPKSGSSAHWFVGDGMLHGVRLRDGNADWYRNRWIQTRALTEPGARLVDDVGNVDHTVGVNNTHVVHHAGKTLALVESSFPCEIGPDLETIGVYDFNGALNSAMTAHPKICPVTGEMHFFGYGFFEPYLTYHRVGADGRLVQSQVIDVTGPTMIHDFAITDKHVIFMDLPIVFDLDQAMQGSMPFHWDDDYPARVGVMDRSFDGGIASANGSPNTDGAKKVRWFDVDPCYVFHPMNAFVDEAGRVAVDTARYEKLWAGTSSNFNTDASLYRWTLDLENETTSEEALDDRPIEFPRIDDSRAGLRNRYGYAVATFDDGNAVVKYDLEKDTSATHDFGDKKVPGEAVFVAKENPAAEDDGWLMMYVYDKPTATSSLAILNAQDMEASPVAQVQLPQRVPFGFHGSWIAD